MFRSQCFIHFGTVCEVFTNQGSLANRGIFTKRCLKNLWRKRRGMLDQASEMTDALLLPPLHQPQSYIYTYLYYHHRLNNITCFTIILQETVSTLLAGAGRSEPLRGHHGFRLAADIGVARHRYGVPRQHRGARGADGCSLRDVSATLPHVSPRLRRPLHGAVLAPAGRHRPALYRRLLQLRLRLAER